MQSSTQSRFTDVAQSTSPEGRFRLIAELGRGGMATVFLAIRSGVGGFNKLQVVKQLHPRLASDPAFLKMFLDEARLAARLNHPNVVQSYEIGVDAGNHFIAMEYLEGPPLESMTRLLAKKNGDADPISDSFTIPMRLRILADVLAGLHYAHDLADFDGKPLQIVHRDVSPHNVIVTYDGQVKLVDFGIAKAADSSDDTQTGVMKGKAAYMAPERFGRGVVDRRSDVFSVAAMLWQMLTGEKLWKGLSDLEIFQRLAAGQIPSPRTLDPTIPEDLADICMRGLAVQANDRYQSALDMQSALEDYLTKFPRLTQREIGAWVSAQFSERRAKIRAIVEEQIKLQPTGPLPQLAAAPSRESTESLLDDEQQISPLLDDGAAQVAGAIAVGPRPGMAKAVRLLALGAVLVVLGVSSAIVLVKQRATEGTSKQAKVVTPFGNPSTPLVSVNLKAVPENASIFLDDVKLTSNPVTSSMVRDGAQHRIRAEAPGYVTKKDFITFDSDVVNYEFSLEQEKAAPKAPDKKPAAPVFVGGGKPGPAKPPTGGADPGTTPTVAAPTVTAEPPPETTGKKPPKKLIIDTNDDPWKK